MEGFVRTDAELLIISDTAMLRKDGSVMAFEPTLREVEHLCLLFRKVKWIGYNVGSDISGNLRSTVANNLELLPITPMRGGKSFRQKLKIVPFLPTLAIRVITEVLRHNFIHTRGPSVPALCVILFSLFDRRRRYWHKYAGNWMQANAPWAYAVQRSLLKRATYTTVTINGTWPAQPSHILSFENPCLSSAEIENASRASAEKSFNFPLSFCFVGSLVPLKGVAQLLEALRSFESKELINEFFIVGDGPERQKLQEYAKKYSLNVTFCGAMKRQDIDLIYKRCHILVLPSDTEGFPKVVAEAAAFGCIPVTTDVSSIGQYVKTGINGVLMSGNKPENIIRSFDYLVENQTLIQAMARRATALSSLFGFERYMKRVRNEIVLRNEPN